MRRRKPFSAWRIAGLSLLIVFAVIALVLVGLATPPGQALVAGMIVRAAAGSGITVSIDRLNGWLPFSVGATKIVLEDEKGPFAEVEGLSIDFRTLALLTGTVALDSMKADRVALMRLPELPSGKSSDGALLPFAARDVQVARLELGEGLAGRPAVLALTGAAASGADGSLAARVNASRIDGQTATLDATIARADGTTPLTAKIALAEGADGILPGLMGRTTAPGYTLDANAGLAGDALTGTVSLASTGDARFAGKFMLSPAGSGQRLTLDGNGNLAELVPPAYASLLSGPIDLAVDADWVPVEGETLPRITLRRGEIETDSVHASATGALGGSATDLSLAVDVARPDGGAIALPFAGEDAAMTSLSLTGKAMPKGDAIRMELTGRLAGLAIGGMRVPGTGLSLAIETRRAEPLAGEKLPFGLRLEADAIETATGRLAATPQAPLVLTADGAFDPATGTIETDARVTAAGGALAFAGTAADGAIAGRTTAAFPDLAPLTPLAGRSLAGRLDAVADGTIAGTDTDLAVSGTATDLDVGDARLARLLAGATAFSAKVRGTNDGGWAISDLTLDGDGVTARGTATVGGATIAANLEGTVPDLARLADASEGSASFTLTASGAAARPDIDAKIVVSDGRLLDQTIQNATIEVRGAPTDSGWRAGLGLDGRLAGGPLSGTAVVTLDRDGGGLAFPEVDLAVGSNRITGALTSTAVGPLTGTLDVKAPDLATLSALALVKARGQGNARIALSADGDRQSLTVTFSGADVAYQDISAGAVEGNVSVADAFGTPAIRGDVTISNVVAGGTTLQTIRATATGDGGGTLIEASARGPDVNLTGTARLAGDTLAINALSGTAFNVPVRLGQPVTIALGGAQSRIPGATLSIAGGTVRVEGTVAPRLDMTVTLSGVPASVVNGFAPGLGAQGTVSGRAVLTGDPAAPAINWQLDWNGFTVASTRAARLPALTISARGQGGTRRSTLSATLSGAGLSLNVEGDVPFAGAGLDLRVTGTAPLALLALASDRELRLAGNARVNVSVTGALAAPTINGGADLIDATFADSDSGFGVSGASGRITFDGRTATIQNVTGRFAQGGEIVISGTVATGQPQLPANITVRVNNGRYSDGDVVNTTFSGNLALNGPLLGNGTVSGTIDLGRTEILLPERLGSGATAIEVEHVNTPPGFVPPVPRVRPGGRSAPAPSGGGLNLDVTVTGNRGVFVRGFGIDAELGGSLRLTGTTGNPQAVGGLQMQRGRMDAVGRRFTFTSGVLTFAGSLIPVLDFSATTRVTDATVTLNVTGLATDPKITFTSSPDMPQEEILSRLLFGQSVGRLSAAQAIQLVDAVGQLAGGGRGGGIVSRIRNATGLDDLDIRQGDAGGTTVGIGKRLGDRIRLGVEAGTGGDKSRVVIDLDITENLKARGGAGDDGSGEVGLTYEREY